MDTSSFRSIACDLDGNSPVPAARILDDGDADREQIEVCERQLVEDVIIGRVEPDRGGTRRRAGSRCA